MTNSKEQLSMILNDFETLTHALLLSYFAPKNQRINEDIKLSCTQIIDLFIIKQKELQRLLIEIKEKVIIQKEIETLKKAVRSKDQVIISLWSELKKAEEILRETMCKATEKLQAMREVKTKPVDSNDLIKYAAKLSTHDNAITSPLDWQPNDPRRPYPTETEMKLSLFYEDNNKSNPKGTKKFTGYTVLTPSSRIHTLSFQTMF
ncbi:hypothetical protein TKK_0018982 [Trichogramma kaykai]|uniref:Mediator of RNA polymerase II transcription subunit 4 n=1 Tax=Trichogramma kaykai TaxID=54128 RepID=A0ABD2VV69_9HYME